MAPSKRKATFCGSSSYIRRISRAFWDHSPSRFETRVDGGDLRWVDRDFAVKSDAPGEAQFVHQRRFGIETKTRRIDRCDAKPARNQHDLLSDRRKVIVLERNADLGGKIRRAEDQAVEPPGKCCALRKSQSVRTDSTAPKSRTRTDRLDPSPLWLG